MIDFRDRDSFIPNLVSVSAVIALAGGLVLMLLPDPQPKPISETRKAETKLKLQTRDLEDRYNVAHTTVMANTWTGLPQDINATILQRVTALARAHNVKLTAFRPQRANKVDSLDTLPYLLIVEGSFLDVLTMTRDVEKPSNRLAISLIQLASADTNSDRVTANVSVVAYLTPEAPDATLDKEGNTTRA